MDAVPRLPYAFAKRHGVLLVRAEDGSAELVHRPKPAATAILEVQRIIGTTPRLAEISADEFERRLHANYSGDASGAQEAADALDEDLDLASVAEALGEPEDLLESQDDAPIIRLINALLTEAVKANASDIHIEPYENRLVVRMRVDGVLREVLAPKRGLAPLVVSRVKVMAKLDIAEKRLPQDGRISLRVAGRPVDVRVSTLPSGHGERVVLRLLDKQAGRLHLDQLGMAAEPQRVLDGLIRKPHGIILVTGPTGSGKTTTLYAALSRLNDRSRNIMTVEDPIEYFIDGIGQTQVNTRVDMTFARGLRAILRQDPDVVMVGEVRDLETAEIAVQASLTGHLVLSTLHTNSAVGAVTRLRDMGVEPFLLSSSLTGLLAQRLVRILCKSCRRPAEADDREMGLLGLAAGATRPVLYHPVGCASCAQTGFHGRSGIYELVSIDDALRTMIHDGASEQVMERHARAHGPGILDDGRRRVLAGDTTLEESLRVTRVD